MKNENSKGWNPPKKDLKDKMIEALNVKLRKAESKDPVSVLRAVKSNQCFTCKNYQKVFSECPEFKEHSVGVDSKGNRIRCCLFNKNRFLHFWLKIAYWYYGV